MKGSEPGRTVAHDPDALEDIKTVLAKYPDVSLDEQHRLGVFLRRGASIDIGLLSSDAQLWARADSFRRDHPQYFKIGARVYAAWAAALVMLAGALVVIKDIGLN